MNTSRSPRLIKLARRAILMAGREQDDSRKNRAFEWISSRVSYRSGNKMKHITRQAINGWYLRGMIPFQWMAVISELSGLRISAIDPSIKFASNIGTKIGQEPPILVLVDGLADYCGLPTPEIRKMLRDHPELLPRRLHPPLTRAPRWVVKDVMQWQRAITARWLREAVKDRRKNRPRR